MKIGKVLGSVLGVAVMLAWWSFRGGPSSHSAADQIPAQVWSGGGGVVTISAETSHRARMSVTFETNVQLDDPRHQSLETWENVEAGTHRYTIDVPAETSGTVELTLIDPPVGASAKLRVEVGGRVVGENSDRLNEPLPKGYGFGAQIAFDDYVTGRLSTD